MHAENVGTIDGSLDGGDTNPRSAFCVLVKYTQDGLESCAQTRTESEYEKCITLRRILNKIEIYS